MFIERIFSESVYSKQKTLQVLAAKKLKKDIRSYAFRNKNTVIDNFEKIDPFKQVLIMGDFYKISKFYPGARTWTMDCILKEITSLDKLFHLHHTIREYLIINAPSKILSVWEDEFNDGFKKFNFIRIDGHYCYNSSQQQFSKVIKIPKKFKKITLKDYALNRRNFCPKCHQSLYSFIKPLLLKKPFKKFNRVNKLDFPEDYKNENCNFSFLEKAFRDKYLKYPCISSVYLDDFKVKIGYFTFDRECAKFYLGTPPKTYSSYDYDYKKIFKDFNENDPIWRARPWGIYVFSDWINTDPNILQFMVDNNYKFSRNEYQFIHCITHQNSQ